MIKLACLLRALYAKIVFHTDQLMFGTKCCGFTLKSFLSE